MKKILIAFDVDWTLIVNEPHWECTYTPNHKIVHLLRTLSSFKNIKILVWSGWWKEHCDRAVEELWIESFVWKTASKNHKWKDENWKHVFQPDYKPDIAIDDIQACDLWIINLIVREK